MRTRMRRGLLPDHATICEPCKASWRSAIAEKLPEEVPTPLEESWRASRTRPLPTEYQLRAAKSLAERTRCADLETAVTGATKRRQTGANEFTRGARWLLIARSTFSEWPRIAARSR